MGVEERKKHLGLLAKCPADRLDVYWRKLGLSPEFDWLRVPEIGGVMVQGRMGGTGSAFNLGEMTVTRCAVRLADGHVGHGYVQGRSRQKAEQAALIDALMQTDQADQVAQEILTPLAELAARDRAARTAKAAGTKVDFFTMVRGED